MSARKGKSWDEHYVDLVDFHRVNGHANVPNRYQLNTALGQWVGKQRRDGAVGKLPVEKRTRLDRLGFDWETSKEKADRIWNEMYKKLVSYKEQEGDCLVPKEYGVDPKLGKWVSHQRTHYKNRTLRKDRLEILEAIGFEWIASPHLTWSANRDISREEGQWEEQFLALRDFFKENGHSMVSSSYKKSTEGKPHPLGTWVLVQRRLYAQGLIRPDREKRLEDLNFVWKIDVADSEKSSNQKRWDELYDRLVEFRGKFGHCLVPAQYKEDPELGQWVRRQREAWRSEKLDERRKDKLNAINFCFGVLESQWNSMFDRLINFQTKFGHCSVPSRFEEDKELGTWVQVQRRLWNQGKLDKHNEDRLMAIGFCFAPFEDKWDHMFEQLSKYKDQFGTTFVERGKGDEKLYFFAVQQRHKYRMKKLDASRRDQLESIGFEWEDPRGPDGSPLLQAQWKGMFEQLKRFRDRCGTTCVSHNQDPKLYEWTRTQRRAHRNEKMTLDRRKLLDSIGFDWEGPSIEISNEEAFDTSDEEGDRSQLAIDDVSSRSNPGDVDDERNPAAKRQRLAKR